MVLNGTTVQSLVTLRLGYGEMTTTGRRLTISGGWKPVLKSHIHNVPVRGWNASAIG